MAETFIPHENCRAAGGDCFREGECLSNCTGAPGSTDAERAAWLADKIVAHGDYAKEAAAMLRRWPAGVIASREDQQ